MVDSKKWLVPTNNGTPILETPPLAYWTVALSLKIFGVSAAAARLPVALAMLGSVALTFLIGERLAGYWRGFAAGLIHVCSVGPFLAGRLVTPDAIYALLITAAIYCAVRGYQHKKSRRAWFAGLCFATALATLTKGPGALFYLAAIFAGLSIFFRQARLRFRPLLRWENLALFLLVVVPWFVWAHRSFPGFLVHFFSWTERTNLPRWSFVMWHLAWWFPAIFLVLPGIILGPRKIFRPDEITFADALPLAWLAIGLLAPLLPGERQVFSFLAAAPGFAAAGFSAGTPSPRSSRRTRQSRGW